MLVYRAETIKGLGIFGVARLSLQHIDCDGDHPGPYDDGITIKDKWDWVFACVDKAALKVWFGPILHELSAYKVYVNVYEVSEYEVGRKGTQLIFNPETAQKLYSLDQRELEQLHKEWMEE